MLLNLTPAPILVAMTASLIAVLVVAAVAILIVLWAIGIYNKLVQLRNRFKNAFSQIDVQLKRRHDLIPNLVETAKGYMSHEKETLDAVMKARASATQAQINVDGDPTNLAAMAELKGAEGALTGALGRLMAVAEAYPDLKANQNMMQLSEELTSTENKVAFSRQAYNDSVLSYKNYRESFPPIILANILGFGDAAFFEIEDEQQREAPEVSFS
jgi:LemA protein